jgi:hypothetical protein
VAGGSLERYFTGNLPYIHSIEVMAFDIVQGGEVALVFFLLA